MAKNNETMVKVKALVPVNYDGTLYGPGLPDGDEVDVRQPDLTQLQAVGAVEEIAQDAAPAQ